jgi:hypothetical protein
LIRAVFFCLTALFTSVDILILITSSAGIIRIFSSRSVLCSFFVAASVNCVEVLFHSKNEPPEFSVIAS